MAAFFWFEWRRSNAAEAAIRGERGEIQNSSRLFSLRPLRIAASAAFLLRRAEKTPFQPKLKRGQFGVIL
jgi:hypothetical protein